MLSGAKLYQAAKNVIHPADPTPTRPRPDPTPTRPDQTIKILRKILSKSPAAGKPMPTIVAMACCSPPTISAVSSAPCVSMCVPTSSLLACLRLRVLEKNFIIELLGARCAKLLCDSYESRGYGRIPLHAQTCRTPLALCTHLAGRKFAILDISSKHPAASSGGVTDPGRLSSNQT